jgi:hypothetical protein
MKNNLLIKEDGYICNGTIALKEKYVLVNKNLNVDFVTLLEMAEINKMLLNPKWKTIIDVLEINNNIELKEVEILENELSKILYSIKLENKEIRMHKDAIDKILSIDANIKLCYDKKSKYSDKLYIMLNDEIIGNICASC